MCLRAKYLTSLRSEVPSVTLPTAMLETVEDVVSVSTTVAFQAIITFIITKIYIAHMPDSKISHQIESEVR